MTDHRPLALFELTVSGVIERRPDFILGSASLMLDVLTVSAEGSLPLVSDASMTLDALVLIASGKFMKRHFEGKAKTAWILRKIK